MENQNRPGELLTWRALPTDPECDELRIDVAFGMWPYRVITYSDQAIVERYGANGPRRRVIKRSSVEGPAEELRAQAQAMALSWESIARARLVEMGLAP